MKKNLSIIFLIFSFAKIIACSCDIPKPILEFQSSEYVFEGKVISKTYASDSLTYTVIFDILKHYKIGDNPKTLEFTFKSEGEFTGEWTSCDWNVENNEKWLVYSYYWNDKLTFGYYCSNSKPLNAKGVFQTEQRILDNANEFIVNKYIFTNLDGRFMNSKPKVNLDSILNIYSKKEYGKSYIENRVNIVVDIDENGKLLAANLTSKEHLHTDYNSTIDSVFNLSKPPNIEIIRPKTEFEKDIIDIIKKIDKWEITYIDKTKIPVKNRKFMQFYKELNEIKVYY